MTTARDVIAKAVAECADEPLDEVSSRAFYADADAILAALLSAPDSVRQELAALLNPWREISTAPKDGTRILVAFQNHEGRTKQTCVRWDDDNGWLVGHDRAKNIYFGLNRRKPTHWLPLPLPAPPSEDK